MTQPTPLRQTATLCSFSQRIKHKTTAVGAPLRHNFVIGFVKTSPEPRNPFI